MAKIEDEYPKMPWDYPVDESENDEFEHGEHDPSGCWNCDGNQTWCSFCGQWTRTCCEDYGDCPCS